MKNSITIVESLENLNPNDFKIETICTAYLLFMGRYEGDAEYRYLKFPFCFYANPKRVQDVLDTGAPELALSFSEDLESETWLQMLGVRQEFIAAVEPKIREFFTK